MRQTRTHAFARPSAGVWLWPHELDALMRAPAWHLALLVHLVARSDFRTGSGRTSWGELVNALTPDQPERGPRLWAPSTMDVRRAVESMARACILVVDRARNVREEAVFFELAPRTGRGVARPKLDRELDRVPTEGKPAETRQGSRTGLPAGNSIRARTPVDNSPTPEVVARLKLLSKKLTGARGG